MQDCTGQIGLVTAPETFHQRVIIWVTRTPIYHVIVGVSELDCVSPGMDGTTVDDISDFPEIIWSEYDLSPEQRQGIVAYALKHVGKRYNWLDNVAIAIEFALGRHFPPFLRRFFEKPGTYHCAQLAYDSLVLGGNIPVFEGKRPPGGLYPGLFLQEYERMGWDTAPQPNPAYREPDEEYDSPYDGRIDFVGPLGILET